jgi:hypothetical protein
MGARRLRGTAEELPRGLPGRGGDISEPLWFIPVFGIGVLDKGLQNATKSALSGSVAQEGSTSSGSDEGRLDATAGRQSLLGIAPPFSVHCVGLFVEMGEGSTKLILGETFTF